MTSEYDEFLEAQCVEEEIKGRTASPINLIAALRGHAKMGLRESKDTVDSFLERRVSASPPTSTAIDYDAFLTEQIAAMKQKQEKPDRLHLIKALRERTNLELRETKEIVDDFCKRNHSEMPASVGEGIHDPGFLSTLAKMFCL